MTSKATVGVITSPYKNILGTPWKIGFQDLQISSLTIESWGMACGGETFAYIQQSAGGVISVIKLTSEGRSPQTLRLMSHKGPIADLGYNPFDDNMLLSCSDDATLNLWKIPLETSAWNTGVLPILTLSGHTKKVNVCKWNPVASNIIASGASDPSINVWNAVTGQTITSLPVPAFILGISWNIQGNLLATVAKDKTLRISDPRDKKIVGEVLAHEGTKSSKVVWVDGQKGNSNCLITTGFTKMAQRELKLWDIRNIRSPLEQLPIDHGSGFILPHWEESTGLLFLVPRGETYIRPYVYEGGKFMRIADFKDRSAQRFMTFLPSRFVDTSKTEIVRCYKGDENGTVITPISFNIIRKDPSKFHADLYPPCLAGVPNLTHEAWINGEKAEPLRVTFPDKKIISTNIVEETKKLIPENENISQLAKSNEQIPSKTVEGGLLKTGETTLDSVIPSSKSSSTLPKSSEINNNVVNNTKKAITMKTPVIDSSKSPKTKSESDGNLKDLSNTTEFNGNSFEQHGKSASTTIGNQSNNSTLPTKTPISFPKVSALPINGSTSSTDSAKLSMEGAHNKAKNATDSSTNVSTPSAKIGTPALKSPTAASKVGTPALKSPTAASKIGTPALKSPTAASKIGTPALKSPTAASKVGTPALKSPTAASKVGTPALKSPTAASKVGTPALKSPTAASKVGTPALKSPTAASKIGTPALKSPTTASKIGISSEKGSTPTVKIPTAASNSSASQLTKNSGSLIQLVGSDNVTTSTLAMDTSSTFNKTSGDVSLEKNEMVEKKVGSNNIVLPDDKNTSVKKIAGKSPSLTKENTSDGITDAKQINGTEKTSFGSKTSLNYVVPIDKPILKQSSPVEKVSKKPVTGGLKSQAMNTNTVSLKSNEKGLDFSQVEKYLLESQALNNSLKELCVTAKMDLKLLRLENESLLQDLKHVSNNI